MRNLLLLAGALGVLACTTAFAADYDDPAYGTAATNGGSVERGDRPDYGDMAAAGWPMPAAMRVMGLLSKDEVQKMRDAHAAAGLTLGLSIVPAGGINAGKYYVSGTLAPEMMAAM